MSKSKIIVRCPKCKTVYNNEVDASIYCVCGCMFGVNKDGKLDGNIIENYSEDLGD